MPKRTNFFSAIPQSFYSKELYREVADFWRSRAVFYLIFILALCWIPGMIGLYQGHKHVMQNILPEILPQVPTLTFQNGTVHTPEARPYTIAYKGTPLLVIDTTDNASLSGNEAYAVLRKDALLIQGSPGTQTLSLKDVPATVVDQSTLQGWVAKYRTWFPRIFLPLAFLLSIAKRLLQAGFGTMMGLVFAQWFEAPLGIAATFALSIVAMTPALIFQTLVQIGHRPLPFQGLISLFIMLAFLVMAIGFNSPGEDASDDSRHANP